MKCDTWCGLKTHQRGRALQIYLPFSSFLFLLAFLSVTQYLPGAVYSGPLFHSSVALASASPGVFTLYFLSPPLPLRTVGYILRILSFFVGFFLSVELSPSLLLRWCSLAPIFSKPPIIFKFSFMLTLFVITFSSPPLLFPCLFLYFCWPPQSAGHGVLPSVQDDMSGWRDTSCVVPSNTYKPILTCRKTLLLQLLGLYWIFVWQH